MTREHGGREEGGVDGREEFANNNCEPENYGRMMAAGEAAEEREQMKMMTMRVDGWRLLLTDRQRRC
jgi:hypothetical protein